ncbi:MAG TPA: cytochrome C [Bacteroidetes bacterium]|nr:cytochrome C [Bacteroidota bacterium]
MSKFLAYITVVFLINHLSIVMGQESPLSHHDFKRSSWGGNSPCTPCHITRSGSTKIPSSPIWSKRDTVSIYQVYSSTTLNSYPSLPSGKSKQCLACHDETVANANHMVGPPGKSSLHISLRNSHPISFVYDANLAMTDHGLNDPSTTLSGLGGTIEEDLLEDGRMECTSCHDVHNISRQDSFERDNLNDSKGHAGRTFFSLRKSNTGSALCLTCHNI